MFQPLFIFRNSLTVNGCLLAHVPRCVCVFKRACVRVCIAQVCACMFEINAFTFVGISTHKINSFQFIKHFPSLTGDRSVPRHVNVIQLQQALVQELECYTTKTDRPDCTIHEETLPRMYCSRWRIHCTLSIELYF